MSWFRRGTGDSAEDWARPVGLNAGGVLYVTARSTFRGLAGHPVFGPMAAGAAPRHGGDDDGAHFVDCDGSLFRYILNFLRSGGEEANGSGSVGGGDDDGGGEADPSAAAAAALRLPERFDEWDQLREEARRLRLPALEASIAGRYEYQRTLFARRLPSGVCVRWPATVVVREQQQQRGDPSSPTAAGAAVASPASPLADQLARGATEITITPPVPSLRVSPDGRLVLFGPGAEPLPTVDRLVAVLVAAYGYRVEHWQEREGRVYLSLGDK